MTESALWLPCTQMQHLDEFPPLHIASGKGAYLYDKNNNAYIDAISSWWVNLHGHCHPVINKQIKQQLDTLEHTLLASITHPTIIELAEKLVAITPTNLSKVFFADSGSAAIECALKMSLQYWHQTGKTKKQTFVSLQHGYHGETLGSLSVTDIPLFSKQYAPLLIQHLRIDSPADIFCPNDKTQTEHEQNSLNQLKALLEKQHEQICAFICEPLVQGACGMGMYSAHYLSQAKKLCEQYDVHLIADEIAVGFGRTGTMFACEQANISPDFMCLSKGLTAGYLPMSCVLTNDTIYQAFLDADLNTGLQKGFLHSHSFTGNPLAATAALASLQVFETEKTLQKNQLLITSIKEHINNIKDRHFVKNARHLGMIAAFTINHPQMLGRELLKQALKQGILIRPIGNHVYIMPPYCITQEQLGDLFDGMMQMLESIIDRISKNTSSHTEKLTYQTIDPKLLS